MHASPVGYKEITMPVVARLEHVRQTRAPREPLPLGSGTGNVGTPPPNVLNTVTQQLPTDVNIVGNLSVGGKLSLSQLGITLLEAPENGQDGITLQAAVDMPASYTLRLPPADGTPAQRLTTDGYGNLYWDNPGGGSGFQNGGNAFGEPAILGTLDNYGLTIRTGVGPLSTKARMAFAATGDISFPGMLGSTDRYLTVDTTGNVFSNLPTGIKNTVQVIKDHPVVVGKYYPDVESAVNWANAHATDVTAILIAAGTHQIDNTVELTSPLIWGISGYSTGATVLVPGPGLIGQPMFLLSQNVVPDSVTLQNFSINAFSQPAYMTTPGSVGVDIIGISNFGLINVLIQGCYRGIEIDGENDPTGLQRVLLNSCVILASGDCGLLLDNGGFASVNNLLAYLAGNQLVRVQCTDAAARMTQLSLVASWLTDEATGTADGALARDNATLSVQASRVYDVQNAMVVQNGGRIESVSNLRVGGVTKTYRQVDGASHLRVGNDFVESADNSKFLVVNANNVYFDVIDMQTNIRKTGRMVDEDYDISAVMTGHGNKDPMYRYVSNWLGFKGDGIDLSQEALGGLTAATAVVAQNSPAYTVSFVRGASAGTQDAGLVLATYASDNEPPPVPDANTRSWRLAKRGGDHAFTMVNFDGTTYHMPLILTAAGNLGIGSVTPASRLEVGSGQIAVPAGSVGVPSYSFVGDLNTGIFRPATDSLALTTAGVTRLAIDATGQTTISNLGQGLVHSSVAGLLTSSPLVNADIADSTITNAKLATLVTSSDTPNAIVMRDGSGNFSAGTITAALHGNADTATSAGTFSGNLAGDVTGPQLNTVVAKVGGKTATEVANAVDEVQHATPSLVTSTLVERDSSGNFVANVITASLTGNVSGTASGFTGPLVGMLLEHRARRRFLKLADRLRWRLQMPQRLLQQQLRRQHQVRSCCVI